jgi:hypothetical protein
MLSATGAVCTVNGSHVVIPVTESCIHPKTPTSTIQILTGHIANPYNIDEKLEMIAVSDVSTLVVYIIHAITTQPVWQSCNLLKVPGLPLPLFIGALKDELEKYISTHAPICQLPCTERADISLVLREGRRFPVTDDSSPEWKRIARTIGASSDYPGIEEAKAQNPALERKAADVDTARETRLHLLKSTTNFEAYQIPEIHLVLTDRIVVALYDAYIAMGDRRKALEFAFRLFTSPNLKRLAIKNATFMNRIAAMLIAHPQTTAAIKYMMSYSIFFLLKEERMAGRQIAIDADVEFTATQFRALPVFNCNPDSSPYFPEIYTPRPEIVGMSTIALLYLHGPRRMTTQTEFLERMSIVTGGLLDGVMLKNYGAIFTGSLLVPCNSTSPLEQKYSFKEIIDMFYPGPSAINHLYEEFIAWRAGLMDTDTKHMTDEEFCVYYTTTHPNDEYKRVIGVYTDWKAKCIQLPDIDIAITAACMEEYDARVKDLIARLQMNTSIPLNLIKVPTNYGGYKWAIRSPGVRPIDLFRINVRAVTLHQKYHQCIVKFWWDGVEVRALASGVCAALTGINAWWRWFSSNKIPPAILMKYMQRGYTTLLNNHERKVMCQYVEHDEKYRYMRNNMTSGKISPMHILFSNKHGIRENFPMETIQRHVNTTSFWPHRVPSYMRFHNHGRLISPNIGEFKQSIEIAFYA